MTIVRALFVSALLMSLLPVHAQAEVFRIKGVAAEIVDAPNGVKIGSLLQRADFSVTELKGEWARLSINCWIKRDALSTRRGGPRVDGIEYVNDSSCKLEIIDFDVQYDNGRLRETDLDDAVVLTLRFRNNTPSRIRYWEAELVSLDPLNKVRFRNKLVDASADIEPGQIGEGSWTFDKGFMSEADDPYTVLSTFSKENLRMFFTDAKIVN